MPKEISDDQKEHINLLLEEQTYSPEWQDGFLSTFKKNNYNTQEIVELFEKNKPADIDDIDTNLVQLQKEVEVVEDELKKIKGLLDKKKITNFNFSEEIAPLFDHLTLRETPYNILNLCKTNELRFNIINLMEKDEEFLGNNKLEEFNDEALKSDLDQSIESLTEKIKAFHEKYNKVGSTTTPSSDKNEQLPQICEEKSSQEKNNEDKSNEDTTTDFKEIQKLRNEIVDLLPPTQKGVRKIITETLSAQWKAKKVEDKNKDEKEIIFKVDTTHLLYDTQKLINNIYKEYYDLVDSLIKKSDIHSSNLNTFGSIIFDVYSQNAEEASSTETDATLETPYIQLKEFKESTIKNANALNDIKNKIFKKAKSKNTSNAEMKGENIRPVLIGLQNFLDIVWLQIQSINEYCGVDFDV